MEYEKTVLYFLGKDVVRNFGEEQGNKIFQRASKLYAELVVTTDYHKSPTYERQLRKLVYPVIAYYKTLLAYGYREESALGLVRSETEKAAKESGERLASQMRPVFPYSAFKRNIRNFIEYKFPSSGWVTEGLQVKGKQIGFKVTKCLYVTMTLKFGCPELAQIFCEFEQIAFEGLLPQVVCERGGVIARGYDSCEFCFCKGERSKKKKQ